MQNIKENLLRMKDLSETMLDLAYTAVFLLDKKLAKQVDEMNEEMKQIEEETLKILLKIKESDEERIGIIDLADYIRDVAQTAANIAHLPMTKDFGELARDFLEETDETIITGEISPDSEFANKPLGVSKIRSKTRVRILCIKRNGKWVFKIGKDTVLNPGDFVVAVGSPDAEELFLKAIYTKAREF